MPPPSAAEALNSILRRAAAHRILRIMKTLLVVCGAILLAASAFAGQSSDDLRSPACKNRARTVERTVFVTGSLIPQRVQLRRVGTTTVSPLRIIDRGEIDATGRLTTPGAFISDPAVRIIGH